MIMSSVDDQHRLVGMKWTKSSQLTMNQVDAGALFQHTPAWIRCCWYNSSQQRTDSGMELCFNNAILRFIFWFCQFLISCWLVLSQTCIPMVYACRLTLAVRSVGWAKNWCVAQSNYTVFLNFVALIFYKVSHSRDAPTSLLRHHHPL